MSDVDRLKILEKVASGEISASSAADLLKGNGAEQVAEKEVEVEDLKRAEKSIVITEEFDDRPAGSQPSWFKVRVNDLNSGKQRVAVNIPYKFMRWGLKMGKRFSPELHDLDVAMIDKMATDGGRGMLVEVMDNDSGEHVQIFLE